MTTPLDVLVVGGGPVGACMAALLARMRAVGPALRVGLLQPTDTAAPLEGRVLAFSRASESILAAAGAWSRVEPHAFAYEHMRVWHEGIPPTGDDVLQFDAAEVGEPNLGYIIETHFVTTALLDSFRAAGGHIIGGEFEALIASSDPRELVRVRSTAGEFSAQLLIGADGARSAVRTARGIGVRAASYSQIAIVARVMTQQPHQNTAWQRFVKGGTLALLPLADGAVSIVWSLPEAQARELLVSPATDFEAALVEHSDAALGACKLLGSPTGFALHRLAAERYTDVRCALVGDAAHVVHPLAGQGVNLGLQDTAALAQLCQQALAGGEHLGAQRTLRSYERWRKGENQLMEFAIDAFNRVLAQGSGPMTTLGRQALALTNRSSLLKRFFIGHALGAKPALTAWESDPASPRK